MNEQHDSNLERTVQTSLNEHGSRLGSLSGSLSDVIARVERRRNRRRSVAVVGSLAAITVGVLGIASVSGRSTDQLPGLADAASDDMTAVQATDVAASADAWACQIPVTVADPQPDTQYFALCEPHGFQGEYPEAVPPTTVPECVSFVDTNPPIATTTSTTTTIYEPTNLDTSLTDPIPVTTLWLDSPACVYDDAILLDPTFPGTTLPHAFYEVVAGDSLAGIAARYGVSVEALVDLNGWREGAGHVLLVLDSVMIPLQNYTTTLLPTPECRDLGATTTLPNSSIASASCSVPAVSTTTVVVVAP